MRTSLVLILILIGRLNVSGQADSIEISMFLRSKGEGKADTKRVSDTSKVYIYDFAPKMYGQSTVCFLIVEGDIVTKEINYKVYFSKKGIDMVTGSEKLIRKEYLLDVDGNIILNGSTKKGFTTKSFLLNKHHSDELYQTIKLDFLKLPNDKKLHLLENLKLKRD